MAIELAGEFTFNLVTTTWELENGAVSAKINIEGDVPGYGAVNGTLTMTGTPGTNTGTVSFVGAASGEEMTFGMGNGVFNQVEAGQWRIRSLTSDSSGAVNVSDAILNGEERTYKGSLFTFT